MRVVSGWCRQGVLQEAHMSNIRRKLDVTTRREAVVKALRLGLLKL